MSTRVSSLSIGEAAEYLGLAVDTVRRLERAGKLKATRTSGGHRRFSRTTLTAYVRSQTSDPVTRPAQPVPKPVQPPVRRNPLASAFENVKELEELDDFPVDDFDDDQPELVPPPPAPRFVYTPPVRQPPPVEPPMAVPRFNDDNVKRLSRIKAWGMASIPYDTPGPWRAKVIADLERFVTTVQFPDWVPDWQAQQIVTDRVADLLKPCREELATQAADATEQRTIKALVDDGIRYATMQTIDGWDSTFAARARREVEDELKEQVDARWTTDEVRELVDEILAEYEDDDDEGLDDDD